MNLLDKINITLPSDKDFGGKLLNFLEQFGHLNDNSVEFETSAENFSPKISLSVEEVAIANVSFIGDQVIKVRIENSTDKERKSPHHYSRISIERFNQRIKGLKTSYLDHVGFNLPWFSGIHPEIEKLRNELSNSCLYFKYPTGESWDFIIPGIKEEIEKHEIDFGPIRRPKFEIVSFDKSSTPLIQFDFSVNAKFEDIMNLFPEGIADRELKNVWVYLENPSDIDICFVVGQSQEDDWYKFLETGLIKPNPEN